MKFKDIKEEIKFIQNQTETIKKFAQELREEIEEDELIWNAERLANKNAF